jgi:hypothetical protein
MYAGMENGSWVWWGILWTDLWISSLTPPFIETQDFENEMYQDTCDEQGNHGVFYKSRECIEKEYIHGTYHDGFNQHSLKRSHL